MPVLLFYCLPYLSTTSTRRGKVSFTNLQAKSWWHIFDIFSNRRAAATARPQNWSRPTIKKVFFSSDGAKMIVVSSVILLASRTIRAGQKGNGFSELHHRGVLWGDPYSQKVRWRDRIVVGFLVTLFFHSSKFCEAFYCLQQGWNGQWKYFASKLFRIQHFVV